MEIKKKSSKKKTFGRNKTIKNIIQITISNIVIILAGVVSGFLLPKILGISSYGYFKTYTLYISYVGLFHFGFIDGIYLFYGGSEYGDLNKSQFRFYFHFLLLMQVIISTISILISIFFLDGIYRIIFISVSISIILLNLTSFFQFISQITGRFKELSSRNIIRSILTIISITALVIYFYLNFENYIPYYVYIIIYELIYFILLVWYLHTYKDIVVGPRNSFKNEKQNVLNFFKIGWPLLIGNLCGGIVSVMDRQFVNVLFSNEIYAVYAFAYSMLALVTTATSAISTVLFPTLKHAGLDFFINKYSKYNSMLIILVSVCITLYFPLIFVVNTFLPEYAGSLIIFRIIFPGIIISSSISIIMHNFYKVMNLNKLYLKKTIIILLLTFISNFLCYKIFKTTVAISVASIFTLLSWYIYVEITISHKYGIKCGKIFWYMIIQICAFYLITSIDIWYLGFVIYLTEYLFVTWVFYKDFIKHYVCSWKNKNHPK